ncbi:alpha/beta hydrolase-fold protein [Spongiivirga sp. MCCC 1A20706]|uniref:alpha/beta hydrolase n=1 Tax=Spongiivirga sp. MCCC 1A20706 TaxID=3160963 RepID=UPI00397757A2
MKITYLPILTIFLSLSTVFAQNNPLKTDSTAIEKSYLELPKIQVVPIKDRQANRQYELYIKLPEGYSKNNDKQYPVIYFTDAMWHIEILSGAAEYILEDALLVGISWQKDNDINLMNEVGEHVSRFRDYSVSEHHKSEIQAKYHLGQAKNHLSFIRNDVIKYVESNYHVASNNRTYFGYSLGGEFGAYILLTQPDTFKNYILGSPTINKDTPFLSDNKHKSLNSNLFISYGTLEKELNNFEELICLFRSRNDKSLILKHETIEGNHQTAFPMTGVRSIHWLSSILKE